MIADLRPSEIAGIQHWERIIAAVRGSQLARVWLDFKTGFPQEASGGSAATITALPDFPPPADDKVMSPVG